MWKQIIIICRYLVYILKICKEFLMFLYVWEWYWNCYRLFKKKGCYIANSNKKGKTLTLFFYIYVTSLSIWMKHRYKKAMFTLIECTAPLFQLRKSLLAVDNCHTFPLTNKKLNNMWQGSLFEWPLFAFLTFPCGEKRAKISNLLIIRLVPSFQIICKGWSDRQTKIHL